MTTRKTIISVLLGGVAYWLLDSAMDAFFFRDGTFRSLAFSPAPSEIFMRSVTIALLAAIGYVTLLTSRNKNAVDVLRQKDELLRMTSEMAKVGGWEFDVATMKGTWTDEVARIHGLPPEQETNVELGLSFYAPESRVLITKGIQEAIASATSYDLELEMVTAQGAHKWVRTVGFAVLKDGAVVKVKGIFQDITDRKQAEQSLKETTARIGAVMDSINALIYVADFKTHELLFVNKYGRDIWGEIAGKTCWKTLQEGQTGPCSFCTNDRLVEKDGTPNEVCAWEFQNTVNNHWYDCRDQAIRWHDGRLVRMEIATDITVRKKLEAQLLHAQKMDGIGTLAGGIAHDFNNILSAIIGYSTIAGGKLPEDHQVRHDLNQILAAAERATALTQSLLTFSRKQPVKMELMELNSVLGKFEKFLLRLLREDIEMKLRYSREELTILADRGQLEQVIMNLVTNARDAMPAQGTLTIETKPATLDESFVSAHGYGRPGEYAMLSVSDTGLGMDEKTKRKIFEPFFTTKEPGKGTGLGLAMVYGIVKTHNGFINVYSEPDKGTAFHIYLPLVQAEEKTTVSVKAAPALPKGGTETVLLAEDDASLRKMTATVLKHMGYTVIEAENGQLAVEKFLANKDAVRLVILDGIMPVMNGKEVYREIISLVPQARCIFMSGYAEDVFTKDGVLLDVVEFLAKPVTPTALLHKVREVLDR